MKKILFVLTIALALLACEEQTCWQCKVIETLELSNKAYVQDTTIVDVIGSFVYCGSTEGLYAKIRGIEKIEPVKEYYINGTVFYWEGERIITVEYKTL